MMHKKCAPPRLLIRAVIILAIGVLTLKLYIGFLLENRTKQSFLALIPDDLAKKPVTDERTCSCSANRTILPSPSGSQNAEEETYIQSFSSCDNYSSLRGPHQLVVSYAFYGPSANSFMNGIEENAKRVAEVYTGWTMRVYHSADTGNASELELLCKLWCRYPHLDFCQVGRLPPPLGDLSHLNGMVWRFLVLGDSLVDRFIIRDLDSIPFQREVDAVQEWIKSNLSWHFMHDNPVHNTLVMGGMWGGMNRNLQLSTAIRGHFLLDGDKYYYKGYDQELLTKHLWLSVERSKDFIRHASFVCTKLPGSVPFPSRRLNGEFVGSPVLLYGNQTVSKECPKECRPKNHLDWTTC